MSILYIMDTPATTEEACEACGGSGEVMSDYRSYTVSNACNLCEGVGFHEAASYRPSRIALMLAERNEG